MNEEGPFSISNYLKTLSPNIDGSSDDVDANLVFENVYGVKPVVVNEYRGPDIVESLINDREYKNLMIRNDPYTYREDPNIYNGVSVNDLDLTSAIDPSDLEKDQEIGFFSGLTNTWFAKGVKQSRFKDYGRDPLSPEFTPSDDLLRQSLPQVGYNMEVLDTVIKQSKTQEEFKQNLRLARERYKYNKAYEGASFIDKGFDMFGAILGDPTTYVGGGVYKFASPLLKANLAKKTLGYASIVGTNAGLGVTSEYLNSTAYGESFDPVDSALRNSLVAMGFIIGGKLLSKATSKQPEVPLVEQPSQPTEAGLNNSNNKTIADVSSSDNRTQGTYKEYGSERLLSDIDGSTSPLGSVKKKNLVDTEKGSTEVSSTTSLKDTGGTKVDGGTELSALGSVNLNNVEKLIEKNKSYNPLDSNGSALVNKGSTDSLGKTALVNEGFSDESLIQEGLYSRGRTDMGDTKVHYTRDNTKQDSKVVESGSSKGLDGEIYKDGGARGSDVTPKNVWGLGNTESYYLKAFENAGSYSSVTKAAIKDKETLDRLIAESILINDKFNFSIDASKLDLGRTVIRDAGRVDVFDSSPYAKQFVGAKPVDNLGSSFSDAPKNINELTTGTVNYVASGGKKLTRAQRKKKARLEGVPYVPEVVRPKNEPQIDLIDGFSSMVINDIIGRNINPNNVSYKAPLLKKISEVLDSVEETKPIEKAVEEVTGVDVKGPDVKPSDTEQQTKDTRPLRPSPALVRFADMVNNAVKKLPAVTAIGLMRKLEGTRIAAIADGFYVNRNEGIKHVSPKGNIVYVATRDVGPTGSEVISYHMDVLERFRSYYYGGMHALTKMGFNRNELSMYLRNATTGNEHLVPSELRNTEEFKGLVDAVDEVKLHFGTELISQKKISAHDHEFSPRVISREKVLDLIEERMKKSGGNRSDIEAKYLHFDIQQSLLNGVLLHPKHRLKMIQYYEKHVLEPQREKAADKESVKFHEPTFLEWLKKQANDDALGYVDQNTSRVNLIREDLSDTTPYDYSLGSLPWNTSEKFNGVSVDMIRHDLYDEIERYSRMVIGDSVADLYGCASSKEFADYLNDAVKELAKESKRGLKGEEVQQAQKLARSIFEDSYGITGADTGEVKGYFDAVGRVLKASTFMTKNGLMWLGNFFEQTEAIKNYGALQMIRSVKGLEQAIGDWTNGGMNADMRRSALNILFTNQLKPLKFFGDIYREGYAKNMARYGGNKVLASLVTSVDSLAQASPLTKALHETENSIVGSAQDQFLGELFLHAHGVKALRGGAAFLSERTLERNSIMKEDFDALLKALKEASNYDPKTGQLSIKNEEALREISRSPTLGFTIRRLGDYIANEVIQKTNLGDAFLWEGARDNPWMQMLFQFKSFAIRSLTKRALKSVNRVAEGDVLGQLGSLGIANALGLMNSFAIIGVNSIGMTEKQREEYLMATLGIRRFSDFDQITLEMAFNASINRNNVLAGVMLVAQMAGIGTQYRTTAGADYIASTRDEAFKALSGNALLSNFAAYGTVRNFYNATAFGLNYLFGLGDERIAHDSFRDATLRLTNIPVLSKTTNLFMDDE